MDTNKSTSRRQGRKGDRPSEGSLSANVRDDEQKPHIRLSLQASQPIMAKPTGSGDRVNAAFVHGKFTFLSGEVCASRDKKFMSKYRNRFTRFIKYPAHLSAVDRCESLSWETQNRQQLMSDSIAPDVGTYLVSTQKSAEGIVVVRAGYPCPYDEGPNVEKRMTLS